MSSGLSVLNEDYKVLPGSQSLHRLIQWSRDTCALEFLDDDGERRKYSYRDLRKCVLSTAFLLQTIWSSQDHETHPLRRVVPVLLPQSPGLYVAIPAILEAGAAFCPINLDAPPDRIKFIVEDVSARVVVTTRDYEDLFKWPGGPKLVLIDDTPSVPEGNDDLESNLSPPTPPHDLAYVMYTSGSTGTPKGVAVSHLAVSQSLLAHDRYIPQFRRFLQFASPSFDVSVFEIFFPLFRGSTLVGCRRPHMLNDLPGVIAKLDVDAVELTPTVVSSLIQHRSNVSGLKLLMTIGEMLTRPVVDSFGASNDQDGILYAMYGPTEAAIHCTINPQVESGTNVANIGVPLDTVSAYIVASDDNPNGNATVSILPISEVGELVLGGPQLADEYINRKDQNETAFLSIRGQRAYRTGDKARITPDGKIEILGRMGSGQVKIRGQRVELGEIEDAIYRHPHIKTASASVLHGILVAFVLSRDKILTAREVLEACSTWLPTFMVPSEIVFLDAFPYLPSGKVDKRKLEADFASRRMDESNRAAQWRSPAEEVVGKIMYDLLGVTVSQNNRLAIYGVDSLVAIRMASSIRSAGYHLSPVEILKADNIQSLANMCEKSRDNQKLMALPTARMENFLDAATIEQMFSNAKLESKEIDYTMPCTPVQDAMLLETAIDGVAYKNHAVLDILQHMNIEQVIVALQALAQKNAILRTGFIELPNEKSSYLQVIWKSLPLSQFEVVNDWSSDTGSLQELSILHPLHIQISQCENHIRLFLRLHHALYDAWSMELILDDFEAILGEKQLQERPSYDKVTEEYCIRSSLNDVWSSRNYWKDHLSHFDSIPMPRFYSVTNIKRGLKVTTGQTSIGTRELESAARSLGVSPQSLFQAAYALILGSYLGTKDVCFGTVSSGRTNSIPGIEDIIGPCLETLPIRTDLATSSTMADIARQIHFINRKHLEHSSLPLREIKRACGIDPGQRLFDSLLVWQQTLHDYDHRRNYVKLVESTDFLEFDLTLEITPSLTDVFVKANYQQSVFPPVQIDILLQQLGQLVKTIIQAPETPFPLPDTVFSNDLLSIENAKPVIDLPPGSLTSPIELMAIDFPDKVAIEFANSIGHDHLEVAQVTYAELNFQANRIAHYLISRKVLPDELVCICLEKSAELYISILGAFKTGAGYLPVTPETPADRLRHIISDSNVKVVLTHSSLARPFDALKLSHLILIDRLDLSVLSSENPGFSFESENLAYCVFTSGSTGTPKGVLVTQGNLLSNLQALAELYPHAPQSKLLQSCSQAFDVSVFEIFFAWYIGACLCSAVKDVLFRDIELAIRTLSITHLSLTPTVAALVNPENVPKVEFLVTAGEPLTAKVFNAWADRGLYQGYGPSETTNICTVRPYVTKHHAINNIGPPLKNTSVFVLSPGQEFSLLPRGGEGEFSFGGAQVGRGYLDQQQSISKFVKHPKYGRLYRSGDYGRLLPDGSLSFTGRKDDQVKLRGQRVELSEISSILLRSPEVLDCISLIIEQESQTDQRLVCFWTPAGSPMGEFYCLTPVSSTIQKLFASLIEALPIYMIPSALIPVACLPSTTQGKIDKRRLKSHFKSLSLAYLNQVSNIEKAQARHDWTQLENQITNALCKVAKVDHGDVGPDTSFFSLGIDSISAIFLSRALRDDEAVHAEISDILNHSSVSRLASHVSQVTRPAEKDVFSDSLDFGFDPMFLAATTESFGNAGRPVERILPCTPLQEAMLSAAETSSNETYNNRLILEIKVGEAEFQRVWAEMIKRHEILRTCFVRTGHPRFAYAQVVLRSFNPKGEILSPYLKDSNLDNISPDPLLDGYHPPYCLYFIRSSQKLKLAMSIHHALYDGFAVSILFEEIEMAIRKVALPTPVSFVPFVQYLTSLDLVEADKYWGNLLDEFYPSHFPRALGSTKGRDFRKLRASMTRSQSVCKLSWIDAQVKAHDTSLLPVFQATWASLLSSRLNEADVCFGNMVSGRTVPVENVDRLVAPCFNTIPVRIKDMEKISFLEAFRLLQSQNIDCLPFQLTPLRRIQSRSVREGARLFDSLLILQQPARQLNPSIWTIVEDSGAMDLPVVIEITPQPDTDTIELILHTHCHFMSDSEAAGLLETFDETLKMALQYPRHAIISRSTAAVLNSREPTSRSKLDTMVEGEHRFEDFEPLNTTEMIIRDVVTKFTDIPRAKIKRHMTIHRLGLDSISAVQVAADLRKQGYTVMGSDVLQHPSIAQLALHLLATQKIVHAEPEIYDFDAFDKSYRHKICSSLECPSEHIEAIRPCTPVQCGMLAQTLHTDGQEYINSLCLELIPGASITKLRSAWDACMHRHEMLRTGFVQIDDVKFPFAMVTYNKDVAYLPWIDPKQVLSLGETLRSDPQVIVDSISRCPWTIEVIDGPAKILRFTAHHAIYDAQSLELILSDVASSYAAETSPFGRDRVSIEPVISAILMSKNRDRDVRKKFWQEENKICISRFPDLTPLRRSTTKISLREKVLSFSMAQLEMLCRKQDVSIQAAGQVAWARLLSDYFGQSSVTFGSTLSGRGILENSEKYAFPTIVTLPVGCNVVGTNSELLNKIMQFNSQLHEHQFTPLTWIQNWVGHPEGKLFDTLFAYQKININCDSVRRPWKIVQEEGAADYVVSLEIQPNEAGSVQLRLTFKESMVPEAQAELILDQYDALLLDTLQNPGGSSAKVPNINDDLLSITPATQPMLQSPVETLHEFVELQAEHVPRRTALEFTRSQGTGDLSTRSWSFGQLDMEGNKIANLLLSRGAKNGELIGICFNKCPEASFAILGILKAGCAYVALDPNAPPDRLKFIIEDSQSNLILSIGGVAQTLSGIFTECATENNDTEVLDLDDSELLKGLRSTKPVLARPVAPQDTCYCLYTSGTTGTPKGCEITHENAVQAMMSFRKLFDGHWTENSKWLQFASFHFDVSVLEQFWSWSVGICVATAPRDLLFEDISGMIRRLGITHIDLTPSLARLLHPDDVPSLTKGVFITGGEQLRQEILDAWGDYECIYNGYGPTEATIGVTMYPRVPKNGKPANIGPQFQNVGSYVFKHGTTEPVFRGAIGELCVSGKLLGKGYLNRPELTKERFPYLDEFGERIYRTGDLVRILHDGSFLFLGRADDQIKLRGQRLELSEINEVIKKGVHEVQDVVTLVLKHHKQQKEQLVTFFVPSTIGRTSPSNADLVGSMRDVCKSRLPAYMVPTYFVALNKLPLSANNKADFKELAKTFDNMSISDLQSLDSASNATKKWTVKEQGALKELAKSMNVEIAMLKQSSNIFELGIDSISIIGLTRNLQKEGYRNATLSVVMKNTSIESLVRIMTSDRNESENESNQHLAASQRIAAFAHKHKLAVADELGIEASDIECLAPCTPAQEGMIYRFLGSDDALYFTTFNFLFKDSVDEERLREAWIRTASRLQILRTKFVLTTDGCAQVVLEELKSNWNNISTEGTGDEDVQQIIQAQNAEVHKMEKAAALANPYTISIIHTKKERVMALHIFHGLYDGISLPLLLHKVHEEYQNIPNIDYGLSFHHVLPYGPLAPSPKAEYFWRNALKDHTYHPLARLRSSPPPLNGKDISAMRTIPAIEAQHLLALRNNLGITHQAILLAAWSSVLALILNSDPASTFSLTQGLILSGRSFSLPSTPGSEDTDAQNTIGPLLNTVPFHIGITDGMSWKKFLRSVHAFCVQVVADGLVHTPLRDVLRWCGWGGPASGRARELFDTLFVFQHESVLDGNLEEGPPWNALPGKTVADYPLAFEAQLNANGDIVLTLVGQKEFLDDAAASDILTKVEKALQKLKSPDEAILSLKSTESTQIHQIGGVDISQPRSALSADSFEWTTEAQQIKAEIESLSGIDDINEHSSLFSTGLDSIDIIKLVSRLRKRGVHISVSSIAKSQTIAGMVNEISHTQLLVEKPITSMKECERKLTNNLREAGRLPIDAVTVLPATPLQEGMVAEMIASDYKRYLNHEVFLVPGHVSMGKLKEAWDTVIAKNDILRTQFVEVDDVDLPMSFAQVVSKSGEGLWHMIQLPGNANIKEEIEKAIQSSITMAKEGKLLHLQGIRHGEDQYFVLSIAHALYDGWSLQALHQDVWAAYHGQLVSRPDPRPTLERVMDVDGIEAERFWKTGLIGLQKSTFPLRPGQDSKTRRAIHRGELLSSTPLGKIQAFCRSISISLQTLGQTSWAMLLATYLKQLDVVFGVVLSCRDTEEANEVMYPLMNTVAVRSVIHGSISEMLRYMQEMGNSIRRYQHFPLRKAQALAGIHDGSLFDTLFIYQGRAINALSENERLYESVKSVAEVEFAICVEMEIVDERLIWRTACQDTVLTAADTDAMLGRLDEVLGTVIENSDMPTISSNSDGISICGLQRFVNDKSSTIENVANHVSPSIEATSTATEIIIRKVLSQVSKIPEDQIDRTHTIFHLGLDSISAIKVSSILRHEGIRLGVNDIMKHKAVANLANFISDRDKTPIGKRSTVDEVLANSMKDVNEDDAVQRAGVDPMNVEYMLPVTAGQLYMLARWQKSGGALFVGTFEYRLAGVLEADTLERAWRALLKKYPILRTAFVFLDDGNPAAVQIVLKDVENTIKWASSSAPDSKISLTSPLSLRVKDREDDTLLCLQIHHALYDGVSLPIILRDLQALYESPSADIIPDSSFRHFVALSAVRQSDILHRRREFWEWYLSAPTLLCRRGVTTSDNKKRIEVFEPNNAIENVVKTAQKNGVSVDAILLAAFSKVYRSLLSIENGAASQEDADPEKVQDVIFGLYLASRAGYDEDLSSLAAPTLNLLPIRISPTGTLPEIAQRVQSDLQRLRDAAIAGTSLAEILDWTGVRVNCFVNILKPSDDHAAAQSMSTRLWERSGDERRRRAEIVELQCDPLLRGDAEEEGSSQFLAAYLPSVDVEMRVLDAGAGLEIGVFAPWEYMHVEDARRVVEGMRTQLSGPA